jgi:hypothetical protein
VLREQPVQLALQEQLEQLEQLEQRERQGALRH